LAFYLFVMVALAIGAIARIDVLPERPRREPALAFACGVMALVVGLRYHVGGDWRSYEELFHRISRLDLGEALGASDPAYALVTWSVGSPGGSIWIANLVCGAIFSAGLWRLLKDQPNPWLGLMVAWPYLIIVVAMGYSRQGVAMGLVMAALAGFDRDRLTRFFLLVGLATLFHKSAIIVLPFALLAITTNRVIGAVLIASLGGALYYLTVADSMDRLVSNYVVQRYDSSGAMVRVLMNIPPAIVILWKLRELRFPRDQDKYWRNCAYASFVAVGLLLVGFPSTAVDRLALFLLPLQVIVCARIPAFIANRANIAPITVLGIALWYTIVLFVWLTRGDYAIYWQPYRLYPIFG